VAEAELSCAVVDRD